MCLVPKRRFKTGVGGAGGQQGPAVGGQDGGVYVSMDTRLHLRVLSRRGGTQDFGLAEMTCMYDDDRYFGPWMNLRSITCKHDIFDREELAMVGSDEGGWRLCDELADTDADGGKAMSRETFMDRWRGDKNFLAQALVQET